MRLKLQDGNTVWVLGSLDFNGHSLNIRTATDPVICSDHILFPNRYNDRPLWYRPKE